MKLLTKLGALMERVCIVLDTDTDLANRVRNYTDNFYLFYEEDEYLASGEKVPYYFYWDGNLRTAFFGLLAIFLAYMAIWIRMFCKRPNWVMFATMCVILAIFIYVLRVAYFPNSTYLEWKKDYRNVYVIRFRTKRVLERFEQDYKIAEMLAKPYKEAQEKQEEEQQRLQAEMTEELKNEYRPQYMRLLKYVETLYRVSTPDPECYAGYFTIILPDANDTGLTEHRFAYADKDVGVNNLIDKVVAIECVHIRDRLRNIAKGNTEADSLCPLQHSNVPSDNARTEERSDENG